MKAIQLCELGSDTPIAQACAKCRRVYQIGDAFAERCCDRRCMDCGASISSSGLVRCNDCAAKHSAVVEAERFDKAEKIDAADYDGPVYQPQLGDGSRAYGGTIGDMLDNWDDFFGDDVPPPTYAWACTKRRLQIDLDSLIEQACDDHYEDAESDLRDTAGFAELEAAVKQFNDAVTTETWEPDYKRAVLLQVADPDPTQRAGAEDENS